MAILPTHKILPDTNINGHPANTISVSAISGLNSSNVQSAIEEINIKANSAFEKANNITIDPSIANTANLALITANAAYNIAVLNLMGY